MRIAPLVIPLLLGLSPGVVLAAPWSGSAGPYQVSVEVDPDPPVVGEVHLAARVQHQGRPAQDVKITVESDMSDMPALRALTGELSAVPQGGYAGTVPLPMAGDWRIHLRLSGGAGSGEAMMPLTLGSAAAGLEMCVPPGGTVAVSSGSDQPAPSLMVRTLTAPKVGDNRLRIEVKESDGTPLDGVDVWTGLTMAGMSMQVAPRKAERIGPGLYQRDFRLPMAGQWLLTVDVEAAASRSLDASGQIPTRRLVRQTMYLTTPTPPTSRAHLYALVGALLILALLRRRGTATLLGSSLCLVTALAVGEALRSHGRGDRSMGMEMDMSAPDLGLRGTDLAASVPVLIEPVRRGLLLDVLTLGAEVAPVEEVAVTSSRSGRLAAWSEPVGATVRRGQTLARLADGSAVTAPFAGLLSRRRQESGEVRSDTPLLDLARVDRVRIQARLAVRDRARLQAGAGVQVVYQDLQPPLAARLVGVGEMVDPDSQTVAIEALVPNPGMRLRPGQRVSLRLEVERRNRVLTIPASAVRAEGEHRWVWVVHEVAGQRLVQRRYVLAGLATADQLEVRGGLQEGDEIATWGLEPLQEGVPITPASRGGGPYHNLLLPKR